MKSPSGSRAHCTPSESSSRTPSGPGRHLDGGGLRLETGIAARCVFLLSILCLVAGASQATVRRSGIVEVGPPTQVGPPPTGPEAAGAGTNVNVTEAPSSPQNETSIAADPDDPTNLVGGANDYRNGDAQAGFAYSFDGGQTWVSNTLAGVDPTLGKYDAQGDPAVAAYRDGVFYYAFIDFSRSSDENRLAVATSLDGGVTWPRLGVIVDHPGSGSHDFEDKEYIAVDDTGGARDGNVYVTWTRFPASASPRILFASSTDGGQTFSNPQQISDFAGDYQGSVPAVGPDGEIYVVWQHGASIEFDKSTDGGASWGTDVPVASISEIPLTLPGASFRTNSYPTLAVDRSAGPFHGSLYVAWADASGVGSGPDILLSRSSDGGASWSAPVAISDDTVGAYQWFPWISVDPVGGAVYAVFFDRRDAPSSTFYHTYYSYSTDGGATFAPNVRLSEEISDSLNDGFGGGFIGDYNGLVLTATAAHPYWTDVRDSNSNAEGYTVAVATDSDEDGIANEADNCPADFNPDQTDRDGDGVGDQCDDCILRANGPVIPDAGGNSQIDADGDGFGNMCDPDFNQDLVVSVADYSVLSLCFGESVPGSGPADDPECRESDMNGDGIVAIADFGLLETLYGGPPGPSGKANPTDFDGDGIPNDGDGSGIPGDNPCAGGATTGCDDNCILTANTDQADADADGVGDVCDNCTLRANGPVIPDAGGNSQLDADGDGFGNMCDPDFNQDLVVSVADYSVLSLCFGESVPGKRPGGRPGMPRVRHERRRDRGNCRFRTARDAVWRPAGAVGPRVRRHDAVHAAVARPGRARPTRAGPRSLRAGDVPARA